MNNISDYAAHKRDEEWSEHEERREWRKSQADRREQNERLFGGATVSNHNSKSEQ